MSKGKSTADLIICKHGMVKAEPFIELVNNLDVVSDKAHLKKQLICMGKILTNAQAVEESNPIKYATMMDAFFEILRMGISINSTRNS